MRRISLILSVVVAAAIAGCAQPDQQRADLVPAGESWVVPYLMIGPSFGNAVESNLATQIIDPRPASASLGAPDYDGQRTASAYGRYRSGQVFHPRFLPTAGGGQ